MMRSMLPITWQRGSHHLPAGRMGSPQTRGKEGGRRGVEGEGEGWEGKEIRGNRRKEKGASKPGTEGEPNAGSLSSGGRWRGRQRQRRSLS